MSNKNKKDQKENLVKPNIKKTNWFVVIGYFIGSAGLCWLFLFGLKTQFVKSFELIHSEIDSSIVQSNDPQSDNNGLVPRKIDGVLVKPEDANPYPVALMIDNIPPAWPHSGLSAASVFYETLVEGGATRIMAVFASYNAKKIGPIRSARNYYLEWVSEYNALYGHVGGSPEALAAISGLGIQDFNQFNNGKYFWRDNKRYAPHNVYTSSELIERAIRDKTLNSSRISYESWKFKDDKPTAERTQKPVAIEVHFSAGQTWVSKYVYNFETNNYAKFQAGQPHIDEETGQQLTAKNVIVIIVPEISSYGEKGRITLDVSGEGQAYIFRDGEKILGQWKKPDRTSRTRFFGDQGGEIELNRGITWISIVPKDRTVLYLE